MTALLQFALRGFSLGLYLVIGALWLSWRLSSWCQTHHRDWVLKSRPPTPTREASYVWNFQVQDFQRIMQQVASSKAYLLTKEAQVEESAKVVAAQRESLTILRREIEDLRRELEKRVVTVEKAEQKNIKSLADTYVNMEPEAVVTVFRAMEDDLVVKIMSFMAPDALGPILQTMARGDDVALTHRAAALTERLRLSSGKAKE